VASDVSETLRLTNNRVRELMRCMQSGALVKLEDVEKLLGELTSAAAWLRQVPPHSRLEPEWAKEVANYRSTLEQLQQLLPGIHQRLLAEKARLEAAHTHLTAATAWSDASRNTL
jgi:hypothetical protein